MQQIKKLGDLLNFLSVVIVSAPDKFRRFDFLAEEDQMNLEQAFVELNNGLKFVKEKRNDEVMLARARELLANSLAAYNRGDNIQGAHLLQDLEQIIFPES